MTLIEHDLNELAEQLYLMDKEVRNCCTILLRPKEFYYDTENDCNYLEDFVYSILSRGFKYKFIKFETDDDNEFMELFVYKYDHQFEMYKATEIFKASNSTNMCRIGQYILGKLLGYSDRNMEEFLNTPHGNKEVKIELEDNWFEKNYIDSFDINEVLGERNDDGENEIVQESDKD